MKTLKILMILCIALGLTIMVGCGGAATDNNSKKGSADGDGGNGGGGTAAAADVWALYKTKGRSWTHKSEVAGNASFMKYEVVEVAEDHAMVKMTMCKDADGTPMDGMPEQPATKIEFTKATGGGEATGDAPKTTEETVKAAGKDWTCIVTEAGGNKTWSSKDYPGLVIKMEGESMKMELVKFNDK